VAIGLFAAGAVAIGLTAIGAVTAGVVAGSRPQGGMAAAGNLRIEDGRRGAVGSADPEASSKQGPQPSGESHAGG
jgi:hypothetical protein